MQDLIKSCAIFISSLIFFTIVLMPPDAWAQAQIPADEGDGASPMEITRTSISGSYDYQGEIEVVFPDGWRGLEVYLPDEQTVIAAVGPNGLPNLENPSYGSGIMYLTISQKSGVDAAPGTKPPPFLSEVNGAILKCELRSAKNVLASGVFSEESLSECSVIRSSSDENDNPGAGMLILKSVLIQTINRWVALSFLGPLEALETNEPEFGAAVKSLKVNDAIHLHIPFVRSYFDVYTVIANGSAVHIDVKTSSNISDFMLDEDRGAISFKAEGLAGTDGITEITIGRVLEGPYLVTVNGEATNDFDATQPESSRDTKIVIRYEHGISQVAITGTRVVPEFGIGGIFASPIQLSGIILAAILSFLALIRPKIRP